MAACGSIHPPEIAGNAKIVTRMLSALLLDALGSVSEKGVRLELRVRIYCAMLIQRQRPQLYWLMFLAPYHDFHYGAIA